jgi:hypothetical protein
MTASLAVDRKAEDITHRGVTPSVVVTMMSSPPHLRWLAYRKFPRIGIEDNQDGNARHPRG